MWLFLAIAFAVLLVVSVAVILRLLRIAADHACHIERQRLALDGVRNKMRGEKLEPIIDLVIAEALYEG
jgi:hypothetical protein